MQCNGDTEFSIQCSYLKTKLLIYKFSVFHHIATMKLYKVVDLMEEGLYAELEYRVPA